MAKASGVAVAMVAASGIAVATMVASGVAVATAAESGITVAATSGVAVALVPGVAAVVGATGVVSAATRPAAQRLAPNTQCGPLVASMTPSSAVLRGATTPWTVLVWWALREVRLATKRFSS